MVKQSWVSTSDRSASAMPAPASARCQACAAAFELEDVALRHRQEVLHMRGGAERDRLAEPQRGLDVGQHQGGGAVGHQRAVGALERAGDERVLLALVAAEVVAQVLAQSARTDCRRRSCGSWPRSWRARRTGRPSAGSRGRRSCRKCRRSRPRCRPPRARRRPSAGCARSPARASWSSARRRPPARCGRTWPRSPCRP